jgi:hypothetical protein
MLETKNRKVCFSLVNRKANENFKNLKIYLKNLLNFISKDLRKKKLLLLFSDGNIALLDLPNYSY